MRVPSLRGSIAILCICAAIGFGFLLDRQTQTGSAINPFDGIEISSGVGTKPMSDLIIGSVTDKVTSVEKQYKSIIFTSVLMFMVWGLYGLTCLGLKTLNNSTKQKIPAVLLKVGWGRIFVEQLFLKVFTSDQSAHTKAKQTALDRLSNAFRHIKPGHVH